MVKKYSVTLCMDEIMYFMHNGHDLLPEDPLLMSNFNKGIIEAAFSTLWLLGLTTKTIYEFKTRYTLSYDGKQRCIGGYKFYKPNGNSYEEILRCRLRHVQAMPNEVTIE